MYATEFGRYWQPLLAASIGIALGSALTHYTTSLFGPALLREFGWSRAQFALLGAVPLLMLVLVPLAGRFTDRFGPRRAATIGFVAVPLGFLALSAMTGSIVQFFAISVAQMIFGIFTTTLVFCRVIVERFDKARGIALSLMMTAPPLAGAIAAPLMGALIDREGWRAGYLAMAGITAGGGAIAILMMGRTERREARPRAAAPLPRAELLRLLRHPTFLLIAGGMFLVNVPQVFSSSQLKLIVMDSGLTSMAATWMMSLYALGVIVGRFLSGLALDRIPAHHVAIATLGLPAIGFLMLAAGVSSVGAVGFGVLLIGFAQGAESDVGAFLISRRFDMRNFSLLLSIVTAMIGAGGAAGSLLLSLTLGVDDDYAPFLLASAVATVLGSILFGLTGSRHARAGSAEAGVARAVAGQAMAGEP